MTILIKVTKEILEKSMYCGIGWGGGSIIENCAIAYAVREIFPGAQVGDGIYLYNMNAEKIPIPVEAQGFIGKFDGLMPGDRVKMKPISFEIEVPSEVIDQIGIGDVYKILSESKTLELVSI